MTSEFQKSPRPPDSVSVTGFLASRDVIESRHADGYMSGRLVQAGYNLYVETDSKMFKGLPLELHAKRNNSVREYIFHINMICKLNVFSTRFINHLLSKHYALLQRLCPAVATKFLDRDLGFEILCANKALAEICSTSSKLSRCLTGLRCMRTFDLCGGS